jgi:hypothetical protein
MMSPPRSNTRRTMTNMLLVLPFTVYFFNSSTTSASCNRSS